MKLDDSQKKQFIVLCCLICLALAFGVYRMIGVGKSPNTPSKTQDKKTAQQSRPSGMDNTETASQLQANSLGAVPVGQGQRDPFAPQIVPPSTMNQATPKQPPLPPVRSNIGGGFVPPVMPKMPGISVRGDGNRAQIVTAENPDKELRLTGVVDGRIRIAVIRATNGGRFIVKEGQKINGKYRVDVIGRTSVWLRAGDQKFVLHLGGSNSGENARSI